MLSPDLINKLIAALDAPEAAGIDPTAAIEFASQFGSVNIMTFKDGRCLHPSTGTAAAAIEFIEKHASDDLYFQPAIRRDDTLGKGKREDCLGSKWVWADLDPPKGMTDPTALRAWVQQTIEQLAPLDIPEPQVIVMSGRGLWFYWQLPLVYPVAAIEAINRGLAERLGGDHVQNADRVARLPFTRNGKTGRLARVLHRVEGSTAPGALPMVSENDRSDVETDLPELPPPRSIESIEDFRKVLIDASLSVRDRERLELAALDPVAANSMRSDPIDTSDRSAVMFSWTLSALKAGLPPHIVRDCILSPALGPISAHLLDPRKVPGYARERYAKKQVENALKKLGPIPQGADAKPDADEPEPPQLVSLAPIPDDLPQRPWLVDGLLMDGQVTMISGKGGEGKSLLALQLGAMVAVGKEFAWWKPREPRKVLLLNGEDDIDELRRRLAAACPVMQIDPSLLAGRLLNLKVSNLVLLERDASDDKLKTTPLYFELQKMVRENSIGLIIVDPLVETHVNLDENSNGDMKELIVKLRALARAAKVPVLVVHHSRKGAQGGDQDGARGGSALVNACRTVVTLERMTKEDHARIHPTLEKEKYVRIVGAKANYAARLNDQWLELRPTQIRNGDWSSAFAEVAFGEIEGGFDAATWEHRDAFLEMVRRGTGERPWSTASTGKADVRLEHAVTKDFGVDLGQAKQIIRAFAEHRLIVQGTYRSPSSRTHSDVWIIPGEDLPPHTGAIPF